MYMYMYRDTLYSSMLEVHGKIVLTKRSVATITPRLFLVGIHNTHINIMYSCRKKFIEINVRGASFFFTVLTFKLSTFQDVV